MLATYPTATTVRTPRSLAFRFSVRERPALKEQFAAAWLSAPASQRVAPTRDEVAARALSAIGR